jgi:hypothetical protein
MTVLVAVGWVWVVRKGRIAVIDYAGAIATAGVAPTLVGRAEQNALL